METKQSSIDFLLTELDISKIISKEKLIMAGEVVRKAKEMERELIKESCIMAIMKWNEIWYDHKIEGADIWAEDYCKELFGK